MAELTETKKEKIRKERNFSKSVRIKKNKNGDILAAPKNGCGFYSDCWIQLN